MFKQFSVNMIYRVKIGLNIHPMGGHYLLLKLITSFYNRHGLLYIIKGIHEFKIYRFISTIFQLLIYKQQ